MRLLTLALVGMFVLTTPASAHDNQDFIELVQEVRKSVVVVNNYQVQSTATIITGDGVEPPPAPEQQPPAGFGTGFFIEDGYILTNHHVIENATRVTVRFEDHPREYTMNVVGADPMSDIAILEFIDPAPDMPALPWRDLSTLQVGEEAWAIGHPMGLEYTVTRGIVSYVGRRVANHWQTALQTDVSINRGNSGGPLLDMDGYVIGVNTMILSAGGGSNGLNISVDSMLAQVMAERLIEYGEVRRPRLGIQLGLTSDWQVEATSVVPSSAAAEAGVQAGDIILKMNDVDIKEVSDMFDFLAISEPGEAVEISLLRNGASITETVILGLLEEPPQDRQFLPRQ